MEDANSSPAERKRRLILVGLTLLTGLFVWLTYREVELFVQTWRVRPNAIILVKMGFRVALMMMLTVGAALGPVAFLLKGARSFFRK
jgi:hypothetical protein